MSSHHPAAFINAISDEGTKEEAVKWLQKTWNELCELREENSILHDRQLEYIEKSARQQAEIERLRAFQDFVVANSFVISGECGIGFEIVDDDRLRVGAVVGLIPKDYK